jgi:hypothetical protein
VELATDSLTKTGQSTGNSSWWWWWRRRRRRRRRMMMMMIIIVIIWTTVLLILHASLSHTEDSGFLDYLHEQKSTFST